MDPYFLELLSQQNLLEEDPRAHNKCVRSKLPFVFILLYLGTKCSITDTLMTKYMITRKWLKVETPTTEEWIKVVHEIYIFSVQKQMFCWIRSNWTEYETRAS